ncbi:MAG: hypothetical protein ACYSWO_29965 [Planctomycetota bacterium]|jgi:hypothetical protein
MQTFRFKRIETTEYEVVVRADGYSCAYARASVGDIDFVRDREGVDVAYCGEHTEIVDCSDKVIAMAYACDECETTWTDKDDHITGSNCPACGSYNTPFSSKELEGLGR